MMELFAAARFPVCNNNAGCSSSSSSSGLMESRKKYKNTHQDLSYQVLPFQQIRWYLKDIGSIVVNSTNWNLLLQQISQAKPSQVFTLLRTKLDDTQVHLEVMVHPDRIKNCDPVFNMLCFLFFMEDIQRADGKFPVTIKSSTPLFSHTVHWKGLHLDLINRTVERSPKFASLTCNNNTSIQGGIVCDTESLHPMVISSSHTLVVVQKTRDKTFWKNAFPSAPITVLTCNQMKSSMENIPPADFIVVSNKDLLAQCMQHLTKYKRSAVFMPNPEVSLRRDPLITMYYRCIGVSDSIVDAA